VHSSRLEQLYDAHADALYAFFLQLTRCEVDAADLVQEVFAKLWRRPDWMARWRNPRAALLRMGHNIDSLRMTFQQIARALRISPNTAASRWRYATDKLRVSLRHPLREPHES